MPVETRSRLFLLLDELCEFETSGELFGCSLAELRDAIAGTLDDVAALRPDRPASPLEELRTEVESRGHPDFR